ncbi:hypothetical protein PISMIDRAFT_645358 [Pisolithus microcarpus 441]|uniref:Uncharacterized protein n=1 Tax=Pisolithus microcarpus 441 TaxID=765257 RepID=A0A0C9YI29_9AGAM|nr:hypothetical protein PISMIDRAFT_645358 [Pisolithus microcarpus 441]
MPSVVWRIGTKMLQKLESLKPLAQLVDILTQTLICCSGGMTFQEWGLHISQTGCTSMHRDSLCLTVSLFYYM